MNIFTVLRQHASSQPEVVAVAAPSANRIITYRRLWSRIERATARLQGEWAIGPGDTLAYWGCGHHDALVLYFALARCGARLLPLEHPAQWRSGARLLSESATKMVLHDDDAVGDWNDLGPLCKPLSSLIVDRCPHRPIVPDDVTLPSLLRVNDTRESTGCYCLSSLDQLVQQALTAQASARHIGDALFDAEIFAPIALATLIAGRTLLFS